MQPDPKHFHYDLAETLRAVVGVRALVPEGAFSATTLGTDREGHGVVIDKSGLIVTIGYLVTEAETIWLKLADGRAVSGHVVGYDQETGFGLVQSLGRIDCPALKLGSSGSVQVGMGAVLAGAGGLAHAVAQRVIAKQEFAGYWEYLLDEAIFTAPAHPNWGGTGMLGAAGELLGIGSLNVQQTTKQDQTIDINMVVPIDLLAPILQDMLTLGRPNKPARPWLGLYAVDVEGNVVASGILPKGPAQAAGIVRSDVIVAVGEKKVARLAEFFRAVWALGPAGVEVPLTLLRRGDLVRATITSGDRRSLLRKPRLH